MTIQHTAQGRLSQTSSRKKTKVRRIYHINVLHRTIRHLNEYTFSIVPTQDQKNLVLTGLTLGLLSIIAAFFPLCGLPAAITGLILGLYGFYATSLRRMAFWDIVLSLVGLLLACINTIMLVNAYLGTYLLQ